MPDLLTKLYEIPDDWSFVQQQAELGITIRKPIGTERTSYVGWVGEQFGSVWESEAEVAFMNQPRTCFAAVKDRAFIGFSCYDATALGYFGPLGVEESLRGRGTGRALLLACMLDMKLKGYGYAIIGMTGQLEWYGRYTGAVPIPDTDGQSSGVWKTWVKE